MFTTRIRFVLILLFLIVGIVLQAKNGFSAAWYLYATSLILLFTHFAFGNVWAAFSKLRKGKILEAELLINQIKKPEWLVKQNRTYYHFTKGMIALQQKEFSEAEKQLKNAVGRGLRSNNDNALALLNLAHICFVEKRPEDTKDYLQQARSFNPDDLMIKQKIEEMEKILA
jgi:tetratricopeptide (TPR) repeat protein